MKDDKKITFYGSKASYDHHLRATFCNLGKSNQCRMMLLPFRGGEEGRENFGSNRNYRVPTKCNWQSIQTLLTHTVITRFSCIFIFCLGTMPCLIIIEIKEHPYKDGEEAAHKLWKPPDHSRCAFSSFGKSDNKFNSKVACSFLEGLSFCNL